MKQWRRRVLQVVGVVAVASFTPVANAQDGRTYMFSPVNQYGINLTASYWNPIISYVSAKSGAKLSLKIGRTSADTTSFVLAQEVQFVFSNHLFSPEREGLGFQVFGRRNTPPIQGQLVVPGDSPITDVAQLANQDVGFPGPEAFISYKVPYAYLLLKHISINVVFGGNMDAALVQMFSGYVKAVGGNSQLIAGYAAREGKKFRILWTSEPFHDLALMASNKVPEADRKAVAAAFIGMANDPKGRVILEATSRTVGLPAGTSFIASEVSEYASYRRFYETAPAQLR